MSGQLEDLNFELRIEYERSLQGLQDVFVAIRDIKTQISDLTIQTDKWSDMLDPQETGIAKIVDDWHAVHGIVNGGTERLRVFTAQAYEAADAANRITLGNLSPANNRQETKSLDLIKIASASVAVRAMSLFSGVLKSTQTTMRDVSTSTKQTVSSLDRFRLGLSAAKVNPELNTLPSLFQSISTKVAGVVEGTRGFGDATIAGIPTILASIASGMGKVMGSGDSLQATVSKLVSEFDLKKAALDRVAKIYPTAGTAVDMMKRAMDVIAPAAQKVASAVDKGNDSVREATVWARNFAYLATGSFQKTGTSADLYARGAYHALLPTRLMAFEAKFAQGSLTLMRRAYATLTSPIHAVSMAIAQSRGEFREMRSMLPPLTGGLQLGTRAMRAFAHSTYFITTAGRAVAKVLSPITWTAQKLWGLVAPARAARTGIDGITTSGRPAGIVLRGITAAATGTAKAMKSVAAASVGSIATGGLSKISSMATSAKFALAGVAAGLLMLGTSSAMATEKNEAVFGVMLKDAAQGEALVRSLQNTEAAKLFDNQELLDSGRLLFKAGISAADLAGKTNQLATVAAATSTDVQDLARIYQQGASSGSFGQDKINQLAERGIDIYHALEAATGKSGAALKDMISGGKIGIEEMDAALAHMTEGNGIYAGSLAVMANTTEGKFKTMKNNLSLALGDVMGVVLDVLAPIMTALVSVSGVMRSTFAEFKPYIMFASTAVAWFFSNFVDLSKFAFTSFALFSLTAFNDFIYFFTTTLPAYLTWFSENWKQVFTDAGNLIMTVFKNIAINIGSAMASIWDYIASGGTEKLQFAFVPLLDGFKATVAKLPEIPDRAMTELEQSLNAQVEQLGAGLANSFDDMMAENNLPESTSQLNNQGNITASGDGGTGKGKERTNFAVGSLERGSEAALNAIYAAQNRDKTPQQQLAESKKQTALLAKMANKPEPVVLGAVG